jgi:hypothetical protein
MKATLIQSDKVVFKDGAIREIIIWLVPGPVPPATHSFKYRLVYIVDGVRVIGFDNERGKGDHRHLHGVETPYDFGGIAKLLADFQHLLRTERGE